MANYNIKTTSNWFKVKDLGEFKKEIEKMEGSNFFEYNSSNEVSISSYEGLISCVENGNEIFEFEYNDFIKVIQKHMISDATVFISSIGNEKLNFLSADCCIVTKNDSVYKDFFLGISREFNDGNSIF